MSTPMTITSMSQGILREPAKSEEAYWAEHQANDPTSEEGRYCNGIKFIWPRWPLPRRAVRD